MLANTFASWDFLVLFRAEVKLDFQVQKICQNPSDTVTTLIIKNPDLEQSFSTICCVEYLSRRSVITAGTESCGGF